MRRMRAVPRSAAQEGVVGGLAARARQAWAPENQMRGAVFAGALLLEVVSAVFGGASQGNAPGLMAVEIASLPLLFVSLCLVLAGAAPKAATAPMLLLAAIVAVPLLQLVPLPADVWSHLPGRDLEARIVAAVGLGRPSLPFSLAPEDTWRAAMALAPPAAMFLGALFLGDGQRRALAATWLALALISLGLGVLQMLGGPDSPLYLYQITNPGSPVGLFANRNHQATLLFALMPMAAMFTVGFRGRFEDARAVRALLAVLYIVIAIVGVAVTRSRAGVVLSGLAIVGVAAVIARGGTFRRRWRAAAGVAIGALAAVGAVLIFALGPILERFGEGGEPRFQGWPLVERAAMAFMPLGSGIGSFQAVYGQAEPLIQVSPIYFNHAHNEYLELWLETGVVGAALLLAFVAWLGARMAAIWGRRANEAEGDLAAAASVLVLLVAAHSAVDYPLRTEAIAVLFAFACACLIAPAPIMPAGDTAAAVRRRA